MITAMIHGYGDRLRSYEMVAEIAEGPDDVATRVEPQPTLVTQPAASAQPTV